MAKIQTPAMEKLRKAQTKSRRGDKQSTLGHEAWKRLKRNKLAMVGLCILAVLILLGIFSEVITPYDYIEQDHTVRLQSYSLQHPLGTDNQGRDILTRCLYGIRISLPIGVLSVIFALIIGGILGAIAAFFGGKVDMFIMRFVDIFQSIPPLLMAISIAAAMGSGFINLILALSISSVPLYARLVRGQILTVRQKEYIESARAIGAKNTRQILKHMLPNCLGPIVVQMTFGVAGCILMAATLSYIGLGINPPTPEWGAMLNAGKVYIQTNPHMLIGPGLMIALTVFSINLFGDGLRDALDPRLK